MKKVEVGDRLSLCMLGLLIVSWASLFSMVASIESKKNEEPKATETKMVRMEPVYSKKIGSAWIVDVNVDNLKAIPIEEPVEESIEEIIEESDLGDSLNNEVVAPSFSVFEEGTKEPASEPMTEQAHVSSNRWGIIATDYEKQLLYSITWLESGNQSDDGQQAVVTVIFNRVASSSFPSTIEGVLSQKNPVQFTTWAKLKSATPTEQVKKNVDAVLNGTSNANITNNNWLYFNGVGPNRATVIGGHKFWK